MKENVSIPGSNLPMLGRWFLDPNVWYCWETRENQTCCLNQVNIVTKGLSFCWNYWPRQIVRSPPETKHSCSINYNQKAKLDCFGINNSCTFWLLLLLLVVAFEINSKHIFLLFFCFLSVGCTGGVMDSGSGQ